MLKVVGKSMMGHSTYIVSKYIYPLKIITNYREKKSTSNCRGETWQTPPSPSDQETTDQIRRLVNGTVLY